MATAGSVGERDGLRRDIRESSTHRAYARNVCRKRAEADGQAFSVTGAVNS